jgi:hypothetical protein
VNDPETEILLSVFPSNAMAPPETEEGEEQEETVICSRAMEDKEVSEREERREGVSEEPDILEK